MSVHDVMNGARLNLYDVSDLYHEVQRARKRKEALQARYPHRANDYQYDLNGLRKLEELFASYAELGNEFEVELRVVSR